MKIKDILNSRNVLIKLNNTAGMSSVVAYRVGKNIKLLDDELKPYDDAKKTRYRITSSSMMMHVRKY